MSDILYTTFFIHTLLEWAGLLLASILLLLIYKKRQHILHPLKFYKTHKKGVLITLCSLGVLLVAPLLLIFTFDISSTMHTTIQYNTSNVSTSSSSSSRGLSQSQFVPWKRIGLILIDDKNKEMTEHIGNQIVKSLMDTERFTAVYILSDYTKIDDPQEALDAIFVVRLNECKTIAFLYWRSANVTTQFNLINPRRAEYSLDNTFNIEYEASHTHKSKTTGLCLKAKHLDVVATGIANSISEQLIAKIKEVE